MAASGSTNWQETELGIITEACELVGLIPLGGTPKPALISSCRRTLMQEVRALEKMGLRLWARERTNTIYVTLGGASSTQLVINTGVYYLAPDTLEIMSDASFLRDTSGSDDVDTPLVQMSLRDYQQEARKDQTGRPTRFLVEPNAVDTSATSRQPAVLRVTFHPVPDESSRYEFHYVRTRKLQDFDAPANEWDGPPKWVRFVTYALAVALAFKGSCNANVMRRLKEELEQERALLLPEDTEKGDMQLIPDVPVMGY